MKLYIANCTQQAQDFVYRTPEMPSARTQRIEIGSQTQISGDLSTPQIDAIIEQHRKYGLVRVEEIDRTKPFIGIRASIDKPVPIDKIREAVHHNNEVLQERGRQIRQEAAVVVNNSWEEQTGNQLSKLEMSFVEEDKPGRPAEISDGVRVTRIDQPFGDAPPTRQAKPSGRRRAA